MAMTVKLSSLRADTDLERTGDWVDIQAFPGVSLRVRSINYEPYTTARERLFQRLRRKHGASPIPQDVLTVEIGRLFAQHLLLDWKGFDQPFSSDVAAQKLTDPGYRGLIAAIEAAAGVIGQPKIEVISP